MDEESEIFVVHKVALEAPLARMPIQLSQEAQILTPI